MNRPVSAWKAREQQHREWTRQFWRFVGFGVMGSTAFFLLLTLTLPTFEELENPRYRLASTVYANDGSILGTYFLENRISVPYDSLSPHLVDALISTEDSRYYRHSGIDPEALLRVLFRTVFSGNSESGGGSTITQQLAKLLVGRPSTKGMWKPVRFAVITYVKMKEWLTAIKLERAYTKEEIIAMYLNQVDFLYGAYGIKQASRTYFGKEPSELSVPESAMLVGMLKNPALFNPKRGPKRANDRMFTVLRLMRDHGRLSEETYAQFKDKPIDVKRTFRRLDHNVGLAPHFREYLRIFLTEKLKQHPKPNGEAWDIYKDGLKIYTTIDPAMQAHAEAAAAEHLREHQKHFFEHWKNSDPWTVKPHSETEVPVEARMNSLNDHVFHCERYELVRPELMPLAVEREISDVALYRMKTIEEKEREKKGSGYEKLEEWRKNKSISAEQYDRYREILSSAEWPKLLAEFKAMDVYMKTPVKTKIFVYGLEKNRLGKDSVTFADRDTLISPYDSIRYHRMVLQTGFVSVDPHSGHVKSWVGGVGFRYFKLDHVNRGTRRQVGSIIKPLLYGLSFDWRGFGPCYSVQDVKQVIHRGEAEFNLASDWAPDNAGGGYSGSTVTLVEGLKHSLNSVSAFLMKDMRSTKPFRDFLGKVGIDTSLVPPQPSICLGTPDLSVLEMIGAYTIFPNQGWYSEPLFVIRVEDRNGNEILNLESEQIKNHAMNEQAAFSMTHMLQKVVAGQGGFEGIRSKVGGKTGTTQDQSDGWYMGITPNLVCGVWVGCDERFLRFRSMAYGQGARMARPIFQKFMRKIESDPKIKWNAAADYTKPEPYDIELDCSAYQSPNTFNIFKPQYGEEDFFEGNDTGEDYAE
jgi:penicillin-binding protein 1A